MGKVDTAKSCITETPEGRTFWEYRDGTWVVNARASWWGDRTAVPPASRGAGEHGQPGKDSQDRS